MLPDLREHWQTVYKEKAPDQVSLEKNVREDHTTPSGGHQPFTYCLCQWESEKSLHTAA